MGKTPVDEPQVSEANSDTDILASEFIDTVIIGAGPSGLAMGACLANAAIPFVILERADAVGSAWRNHYERLHLHTVKQHSALPFMPFPKPYPRYPSRQQLVDYLESYAQKFGLKPRFHQEVSSVSQNGDSWETRTPELAVQSQRVIVASGYNRWPNLPSWPGKDEFRGKLIHSSEYRNGEPFRGKRVLVVGIGNTGGEIAIDLHEFGAASIHICVRGPINILPREILGTPCQVSGIVMSYFPDFITDPIGNFLIRAFVGDLTRYGICKPAISPAAQVNKFGRVPLIDIGTIDLIKQGHIKVVPQIERFTSSGVRFVDGTEHEFDIIILATGFKAKIEDFLRDAQGLIDDRGYPIPPAGESKRAGLYFLGFANPSTGFLRQIGIDARRIAKQIVDQQARTATRNA